MLYQTGVYSKEEACGLRKAVGAEGSNPLLLIRAVICLLALARFVVARIHSFLDTKEVSAMDNTLLPAALISTVHAAVEVVGLEIVVITPLS